MIKLLGKKTYNGFKILILEDIIFGIDSAVLSLDPIQTIGAPNFSLYSSEKEKRKIIKKKIKQAEFYIDTKSR